MKTEKLLTLLVLIPTSVLASTPTRFNRPCYLESQDKKLHADTCVVIETRNESGSLNTRNIFSNRFGLTIKGRFVEGKGYMTWDSHNKFEYKWDYKAGEIPMTTYVMPGFLVSEISWD